MSRILYFDCFSGISGDMVLGAFLDAGLPLESLKASLGSLALSGFDVSASRVLRAGVSATKFNVIESGGDLHGGHAQGVEHSHSHGHDHEHVDHHDHDHPHAHDAKSASAPGHSHPHRSLPEIFRLIDRSALSSEGRARAQAMFQRLAEAEAAIHQMPVEEVHLHEVGALDSIIDIVGAVHAMEWAGVDQVVCSPLNVGGGMVNSAHGVFPVPAPATVRLLGDAPVYGGRVQSELVTPTGALIATTYASKFGPIPAMQIEHVGYGAGERQTAGTPNVLRLLIGQQSEQTASERVVVIECEIDDMNPQIFGVVMDQLYAAGALEVFYTSVQMKKNRPGTLLSVIAPPALRAALTALVFRETTTIGVRFQDVERECLDREVVTIETAVGAIRFKVARRQGRVVNASPEFEDCAAAAAAHHLSVKEVQAIAVQAYGAFQSRPL